jgi:Endonuclease NucS
MSRDSKANGWFVICPETEAPGLWNIWQRENCVAIGWGPPTYSLEGDTDNSGWDIARSKAQRIAVGDIVIPYLLKYRLGVPGEVTRIAISDAEWNPTVAKGGYASSPGEAELGRRIELKWLTDGVPSVGKIAVVPRDDRTSGGEAKQTVEGPMNPQRYERIMGMVRNSANWVDYQPGSPNANAAVDEVAPASTGFKPSNLTMQETLVRSILAKNLNTLEAGLKPHPDFSRMEEVSFDLGRFDILCQDRQDCTTVIELQLRDLDDGHIGKLCRYYGWLHRKYGKVRGILLFENAAPDLIDAYKTALPWMELRQFKLSADIALEPK